MKEELFTVYSSYIRFVFLELATPHWGADGGDRAGGGQSPVRRP